MYVFIKFSTWKITYNKNEFIIRDAFGRKQTFSYIEIDKIQRNFKYDKTPLKFITVNGKVIKFNSLKSGDYAFAKTLISKKYYNLITRGKNEKNKKY